MGKTAYGLPKYCVNTNVAASRPRLMTLAPYAGLSLLADFQPDLIKLDMNVVRNMDRGAGPMHHFAKHGADVRRNEDTGDRRRC